MFRRNFALGLCFSVAIHGLLILLWIVARYYTEQKANPSSVIVHILRYSDLGPPPSLTAAPVLPAVAIARTTKRIFGTPVPVPDLEVNPEQTMSTQQELSEQPSPVALDPAQSGGELRITEDIVPNTEKDDREPGIDEVVPVDKSPDIVTTVIPKYPEMAIRANVEGTVWVKFLVGKDGRVLRAVIVKSTSEIFNEVTMEAAVKFVFTPAYTHAGPVKVWFEIPFMFKLKDSPLADHR